jgi:hypothetical protein
VKDKDQKPAPKQQKLSFATKASNEKKSPPATAPPANEDVDMDAEDAETEAAAKQAPSKKVAKLEKENVSPSSNGTYYH